MKDLNILLSKAYQMCQDCSLEVANLNKIKIVYNYRAQRWGNCSKKPDGSYVIQINSSLGDDNLNDQGIMDTILHELCHTVPGGHGHTGAWKIAANKLNKKFGYKIKRTNSSDEKGVQKVAKKPRPIRYKFVCEKCGQLIERTKASNFTKHYERYTCGICKGKFKPIY